MKIDELPSSNLYAAMVLAGGILIHQDAWFPIGPILLGWGAAQWYFLVQKPQDDILLYRRIVEHRRATGSD